MTDPTIALARVKAMHKRRTERHGSGCVQCGIVWPCPTYRELDAAEPAALPVDQTALRDRIAEAARTVQLRLGPNAIGMAERGEPIRLSGGEAWAVAEAVLPVLPEQTDPAAVLREAAEALGRMDYDTDSNDYGYDTYRDAWNGGVMDGADLLRRLAGETPADTEVPCCSDPTCACVQVNAAGQCDCSKWDPQPAAGVRQDGAQTCAECDHPHGAHREGEDPVTPGVCRVCEASSPDDAHHDYEAAT